MKRIVLARRPSTDDGTPGSLWQDGERICYTLECPWRGNQAFASCIPAGVYQVEMRDSPRYGLVYNVKEVPDRTHILIHPGNVAGDEALGKETHSAGCILLGRSRGHLHGQQAVLSSRAAVARFEQRMCAEPFVLEVVEA